MAGQQKSLPKQYGLIIPKKNVGFQRSTLLRTIPALFEDDSDIVDATAKSSSGTRKNNHDIKMKMETEALIHKTLTEDPTAFEYDTVFDRIQAEKAEQEGRARGRENDKNREPKYIQALQKASKEREKEFERRTERKVQREREAEGTEFAEKEAFVTSSYKKKMQEQQEAEAREREMDKVEAKLDVRKQDGLSIFYKHLLKQQTGEEKVKNADEAWSLSVKSGDVEGSRGTADRKRELSVEAESGKRQRGIGEHSQSPSRNSVDVLAVDAESARRSRSISIPGEMKVRTFR